jgi:hypothetical protein
MLFELLLLGAGIKYWAMQAFGLLMGARARRELGTAKKA